MCEAATCFGGEFDSPKNVSCELPVRKSVIEIKVNFPREYLCPQKGKTWSLKPKSSSHLRLAWCDLQWEPEAPLLGSAAGTELGAKGKLEEESLRNDD